MINEKNLFEKGMLISLKTGMYEGRKKLSDEQLKAFPVEIVRGVHDLFEKSFKKKILKVVSLDWDARDRIKNVSVPFPIDGIYFVLSEKIEDVTKMLDDKAVEREALVEDILANYDEAINVFAEKYPEYTSRANYPSKTVLRDRFYFKYQFVKISAPDKDSIISPEQYKKEMAKFKETIDEMKKNVIETIYQELLERTIKIREQCKDEKINQATFNSLSAFMSKIDEVYADFIDRNDVKNMVQKVKAQVLGVTAEKLRGNESAKKKFDKEIKSIVSEIKALPDIPLKRAIDF